MKKLAQNSPVESFSSPSHIAWLHRNLRRPEQMPVQPAAEIAAETGAHKFTGKR